MFESYKDKLNHSQLYIFEKLEKEILGNIKSIENKITAYENLIFTPKKDGNEKQDFKQNFEIIQGVGYHSKQYGLWRFVTIEYDYNNYINERPKTGVNISFSSFMDLTPYKESFKDYLRFNRKDFEDFYKKPLKQEDINARFVFDCIKNFLLPQEKQRLTEYKKEITTLPKDFKKLCIYSNKIAEFENYFSGHSVVRSWAYDNMHGRELHYLRTIENKF